MASRIGIMLLRPSPCGAQCFRRPAVRRPVGPGRFLHAVDATSRRHSGTDWRNPAVRDGYTSAHENMRRHDRFPSPLSPAGIPRAVCNRATGVSGPLWVSRAHPSAAGARRRRLSGGQPSRRAGAPRRVLPGLASAAGQRSAASGRRAYQDVFTAWCARLIQSGGLAPQPIANCSR
jgi:hypothetical protein